MEQGVVRKVLVCFFQDAAGRGRQAPVERVAFDVRVDEDANGSMTSINLQARSMCSRIEKTFGVFRYLVRTNTFPRLYKHVCMAFVSVARYRVHVCNLLGFVRV